MTTGWAAYSGACDDARALAALEGGLEGNRAAGPRAAARDAVLRAFAALSGPNRRLSAGRARERRPVQPRRVVDRRRLRPARGERPRARRSRRRRRALFARAFEIFEKISPLKKTDPETIAVYGLIPIQQPADIYDGWGHGGRGGWSWYTGSAARMLSAAWAMLGIDAGGRRGRRARRPVRGQGRPPGGSRCGSATGPGRAPMSDAERSRMRQGDLPFGVRRLAPSTLVAGRAQNPDGCVAAATRFLA